MGFYSILVIGRTNIRIQKCVFFGLFRAKMTKISIQNPKLIVDATRARTSFNARANDIRDNLFFSHPSQRTLAIQLYCCDGYGSMLWDLRSDYAEKYFKAWNIQMRKAWMVPPMTHTYIVESYFATGHMSLRNQIYSRYAKFVQKLLNSPSKEIQFLSKLLTKDPRSTLNKNIWFLENVTKRDILRTASYELKRSFQFVNFHQMNNGELGYSTF